MKFLPLIEISQSAGLAGLNLTKRSLQQKVYSCKIFFVVTLNFSHVTYGQSIFYFKLIEIRQLHNIKKLFFRFYPMWHDQMFAMLVIQHNRNLKLIDTLKKGVLLRNQVAHGKSPKISGDSLHEILAAIHDCLYLFDCYNGHRWAWDRITIDARKLIHAESSADPARGSQKRSMPTK